MPCKYVTTRESTLTQKNKKQADTAPRLPVDDIESVNSRLVLLHPVSFEVMPDAWIELAPPHSIQGDKAQAAMVAKAKANTIDTTKLSDEEFLALTYKQNRELAARLVVSWNEAYFGAFSTVRALEIMETKRWIYVQVDLHLKNTRNFFTA